MWAVGESFLEKLKVWKLKILPELKRPFLMVQLLAQGFTFHQ